MQYYVYIYLDPRKPGNFKFGQFNFTHEPLYVGKGKNYRMQEHLYKTSRNSKSHFCNILNKIIESGYEPIRYKLFENISQEDSFKKEIELINLIGRKDLLKGTLINHTDGGSGEHVKGRKWTPEQREKLMQIGKLNPPTKGKKWTKETKKKMSDAAKGRIFSEEHRKKLSDARKKLFENGYEQYNKGKQLTEKHKQKLREAKNVI